MAKFEITDLQGGCKLSTGVEMPFFGLGAYKSKDGDEVISAVETALNVGYRHIDTASMYKNELGVGQAIRNSDVAREEIFVTSKVWNDEVRSGNVRESFESTLEKLGFDYLDLYLIHWPVPGSYQGAWKILEALLDEGLVKAIGVSNFLQHHLEDLIAASDVVPMVNQLEFHPYLQQPDLADFCARNGIQFEGWAPLMRGEVFAIPEIREIGERHGKNAAQVTLRWHLQKDTIAIPKSVNEERIRSNADIFDFELSPGEMSVMDGLDKGRRIGPDPDHFSF